MINRIRQFYLNVVSTFQDIDYIFINKYLNEKEVNLFNKLSKMEQQHSIRVAKLAMKKYSSLEGKNNLDRLIKICLLHDIGKINAKLNVFDKVILVICDKVMGDRLRKYTNIHKINIYYNHAQIGAEKLKSLGYDDEFICVIENHHKKNIKGNLFLEILKFCDNNN